MNIGSHNSWTFLRPKKWWMRLLAFTARCQRHNIIVQYKDYGVRCFDLRVRYDTGQFTMAHGIIEYEHTIRDLFDDLWWLDQQAETHNDVVYVRVINEIRRNSDYNSFEVHQFRDFCHMLEDKYKNIRFFCGMNLLPSPTIDYFFGPGPTCEELYASVRKPRLIDDWWPWWYARFNNRKNIEKGTDKDILLIDFVDIR